MRFRRKEKGFAMGLFLVTLMVLGSISASMIYITSQDSTSSNSTNTKNDARIAANLASEYISSQLKIDNNYLYEISSSSTPTSSCLKIQTNLPILNCDGKYSRYGEISTNNPVSLFSNTRCSSSTVSLRTDCISLFVKPIGENGAIASISGVDRVVAARLYVKVRTGCRGLLERCRYTSYQETFRAKNFFDYMYYVKYTTLDPSLYTAAVTGPAPANCENFAVSRDPGCINVSFTANDRFDSNAQFFTEDSYFNFCGNINSTILSNKQILTQAGNSSSINYLADTGCVPTPNRSNEYTNVSQTNTIGGLPSSNASEGARNLMPQASDTKFELASGVCTFKTANSANTFNYTSGIVYIDGSPKSSLTGCMKIIILANIPTGNSFRIIGDSNIDKQVSIVSNGQIIIEGNTYYSTGTALLSLTAEKEIIVSAPPIGCTGLACDKNISAYIFSAKNTIQVDNWDGSKGNPGYALSSVQPKLNFKGAIVSKFQPVFGSFDGNDGNLYSGYIKNLQFDDRVKNGRVYIPYIIDPKVPQWEKYELVEIASTNTP
jgi:hypothetical protein